MIFLVVSSSSQAHSLERECGMRGDECVARWNEIKLKTASLLCNVCESRSVMFWSCFRTNRCIIGLQLQLD